MALVGFILSFCVPILQHTLFRDLFYWVFPPLIQAKLNKFKVNIGTATMSKNKRTKLYL